MVIFLLGGIIGSIGFVFLLVYLSVGNPGAIASELNILIYASIPSGLLGGYGGFRLFKLLKSTSILAKVGFFLLSGIFGFGVLILILVILNIFG